MFVAGCVVMFIDWWWCFQVFFKSFFNTTGHKTSVENFKIIGREGHGISRTIQEAIYIRVNNPTLNRNVGKYNLPHIWDKVLFTTPELKIK